MHSELTYHVTKDVQ